MMNQGGRSKNDTGKAQRREPTNEKQTNAIVRISEQFAANPWVRRLAQLGYGAKGLLYVIVGITAVLAVVNVGQRVRGTRGALNLLVASPFGRTGVAFVAVGLGGFILRSMCWQTVWPKQGIVQREVNNEASYCLRWFR